MMPAANSASRCGSSVCVPSDLDGRHHVNRVLALTRESTIIAMMRKGSFAIRHVGDRQATAIEARSAHSFARHTHDEYGIGVMLAGAQRSWSGRGTVEAGAGDLITVNPGEVHDGTPIGESRTWAMLYLSPERMAAIAADILEGDQTDMEFVSPVLSDRRAADRFVAAYSSLTDDEPEAAGERLILLVAGLLHDKSVPRQVVQSPLAHVRARIDDDPARHHPLFELAQEAGTSQFQTMRGFARLTGLTPHAYIVQRRLDLARLAIRSGTGLADAASAAGFADQSHFHRAFTRRYGLTPGVYAAAMR
jgi:AraC-like DNA-binding protein/quercetin dioxygenase-like cupin family protein